MAIPVQVGEISYFVLPEEAAFPGFLGRYVFPLAPNVLDTYCEAYSPPGGVVLDPFVRSDALARAAARTGRKAVLSDSNPLATFLARATMLPVTGQDLKRAFARLSEAKVGKVSLASHFDAYFATVCPRCEAPAVATEVIWDGLLEGPVAKRCVCAACHLGEGGERESYPTTQADLNAARAVDLRGPHFTALIERLRSGMEGEAELLAQLVDLYSPRTAQILLTLVERIEGSGEGPNVQHLLKLCLLECLSACTRLASESPPAGRGEDINLGTPARWVERNPWRVFGRACLETRRRLEERGADKSTPRLAATVDRVLDANAYGRLGDPPNAIVLRQPARLLKRELPEDSLDLVLCEPPGPSDALFLCLTYVWTGWLFGGSQVQGLEQIPCSTRPMDWSAYFRAIGTAVHGLLPLLKPEGRVVFHFAARQHRQFEMLLLAPVAAGLSLRRVLLQPSDETRYVLEFAKPNAGEQAALQQAAELDHRRLDIAVRHEIDEVLRELLLLRAEPTEYLWLYAAAMERLGRSGLLASLLEQTGFNAEKVADAIHREAAEALERGTRKGHLLRQDLPTLTWSLARMPSDAAALCDRVELAVYNHLSTNRATTLPNVLRLVHRLFPGLATPAEGWIEECLASYGRAGKGGWSLPSEEALARRTEDHSQAIAVLVELGHRLGLRVWIAREEQKRPFDGGTLANLLTVGERYASPANLVGGSQAADVDVIWYDGGTSVWLFEVEWSAAFSQAVVARRLPVKGRRLLVVADERVDLVAQKCARFRWLQPLLDRDGWQFLTWSSLADFATQEGAQASDLDALVGLRPTRQTLGGSVGG